MLKQTQSEMIWNEVLECIRDASSTENTRAIQDSESLVAKEQKNMIKILIAQGWSKNEIIYEMQRVFGQDVLIYPKKLDDHRSFLSKVLPLATTTFIIGGAFVFRRMINLRKVQIEAIKAAAEAEKPNRVKQFEQVVQSQL